MGWCGDFNKHVGNMIPGNHEKVTNGGKLVKEFLESGDYVLVNANSKSTGGPFTRYTPNEPNNEEKKSAIDFVIVSRSLESYIETFEIDKDLQWTPYRAINDEKL